MHCSGGLGGVQGVCTSPVLTAKTQSDRDIERGICYGLITSSMVPKIV